LKEDNTHYRTERLYKEDYTEKEVQELWEKRNKFETEIDYLSEMLSITEFNLTNVSKHNTERYKYEDGELIDNILKVVVEGKIGKYSLRCFVTELEGTSTPIKRSTLGNRFNKENFKLLVFAGIMRKTDKEKRGKGRNNLDSFHQWFKACYMPNIQKTLYQDREGNISESKDDRKRGKVKLGETDLSKTDELINGIEL